MKKYWVVHKTCIVPAPFCAMRYNNDGRYLPGVTTLEAGRLAKLREKTVLVLQGRLSKLPNGFSTFKILSVRAQRNFASHEELLVYYKNKYEFH